MVNSSFGMYVVLLDTTSKIQISGLLLSWCEQQQESRGLQRPTRADEEAQRFTQSCHARRVIHHYRRPLAKSAAKPPAARSSSLFAAVVLLSVPTLECERDEVDPAYVASSSSKRTSSSSMSRSRARLTLPKPFLRGVRPGALTKSAKLVTEVLLLAPRRWLDAGGVRSGTR